MNSKCQYIFASNTLIRSTVETIMLVTFWFFFYQLDVAYAHSSIAYLVYFGCRHFGVGLARYHLQLSLLHPRHQSVNRVNTGAATLFVIKHEETQADDEKLEVKKTILAFTIYGVVACVCLMLESIGTPYTKSKQTSLVW